MARRFRFPLQTLLRVRALHEQEAKRKLAAKQAEIAQLDRLNRQATEEIAAQHGVLRGEQGKAVLDAVALQRGRAWIAHLRRTVAQRMPERLELVRQLGELQDALREARKQTRIIEKLRERRLSEHQRALLRAEQAASDELAQQMHGFDIME